MIKSSPGANFNGSQFNLRKDFFYFTLIQSARHLAAAESGGGALLSDANSNSKIGNGDVTKRLRWLAIFAAIIGKLGTEVQKSAK